MYCMLYNTKSFSLETSDDQTAWMSVVEEALESASAAADSPVVAQGRYVRFTVKTYYGARVGLNCLGWKIYHF